MIHPQPAANNKGFSLLEMMIATMIIVISMLALFQMIEISMDSNLKNELRSAAVRLTNQTAETLLAIPTTADSAVDPLLTSATTTHTRIANDSYQDNVGLPKRQQSIRGTTTTFDITWYVVDNTDTVKQIQITVGYSYKNKSYTNSTTVFKHASGM